MAARPDTPSDSDDVTTLEVARLLGMAVRSVQLMVDRGELQAWKTPGGHRRISRQSVQRWLEQHRGRGALADAPIGRVREARRVAGQGPARVLLIEDSAHYQNLVGLLMRQQFPDVELQIADDGIAGLALYGQFQPDVLIIDILLPGIDGATLITSLRSHPQFSQSRLIVVTSLDPSQRAPYAFALADLPVIHKPRLVLDLPDLLAAALPRSVRPRATVAADRDAA